MDKHCRPDSVFVKTYPRNVKREPDDFENPPTKPRPIDPETLLPPFNPCSATGLSPEQWLATVENVRQLYDWDDGLTLQYASKRLEADAKTWFRRQKCSWVGLKVLLVREFSKNWDETEARQRLMERQKDDRESFENYALDVERLAAKCHYDLEDAINFFIAGLKDWEMRVYLAACDCRTFTEALVRIKAYIAEQEELKNRKITPNRDPRKDLNANDEKSGNMNRACKAINDRKRPSSDTHCNGPPRTVVCQDRHHDDYSDLLMTVRVRGENVTAFVNIASDCTSMKVSEFKRHDWKMKPSDVMLRGFGPGSANVVGQMSANVVAGEVAMLVEVQIVDDVIQEFPMVLGRDFLHSPNVCVVKKFRSVEIRYDSGEPRVKSELLEPASVENDDCGDKEEEQLLELLDLIERDCL